MHLYWTSLDTWIVVAGVLSALSCALLGNFLVLRRMSMMGDAISHAVLPGLAIAFLVTGSRASWPMFVGAAMAGVLTALFTQWISRFGKVEESAAMGVVFTTLFAVGLILIVRAADSVDLDPGCVFYGAIELIPLDTATIMGGEVPRAVIQLAAVLLLNLVFVILFFKELRISAFDPDLATSLGINANLMHYLLMTLVAVTTVASFESVGSILVIAMLIVPAAAAHLLTDRLKSMILVSLAVAALAAASGHLAAITVPTWWGYTDTSTAGMMAVMAGVLLMLTLFFAPRHGVFSKYVHRARLSLSIISDDMLGLLYRLEEFKAEERAPLAIAALRDTLGVGRLNRCLAQWGLRRKGYIDRDGGELILTDAGRGMARNLIRSHRLWETYLHKHILLPVDHLHRSAEALEHVTDPAMQARLARKIDRPVRDPQGKEIPSADQSAGVEKAD